MIISFILLQSCSKIVEKVSLNDILSNKRYPQTKLDNISSHKKNQNGHYKYNETGIELVDSEEIITIYTLEDINIKNLTFYNQMVNTNSDVKIMYYEDHLAFLSFKADNSNYENYISDFLHSLGNPDSLISNNRISNAISNRVKSSILKTFEGSSEIHNSENNTTELKYPQRLFYTKDNLLYTISLDPLDENINLKIEIISKEALRRNLILGYKN